MERAEVRSAAPAAAGDAAFQRVAKRRREGSELHRAEARFAPFPLPHASPMKLAETMEAHSSTARHAAWHAGQRRQRSELLRGELLRVQFQRPRERPMGWTKPVSTQASAVGDAARLAGKLPGSERRQLRELLRAQVLVIQPAPFRACAVERTEPVATAPAAPRQPTGAGRAPLGPNEDEEILGGQVFALPPAPVSHLVVVVAQASTLMWLRALRDETPKVWRARCSNASEGEGGELLRGERPDRAVTVPRERGVGTAQARSASGPVRAAGDAARVAIAEVWFREPRELRRIDCPHRPVPVPDRKVVPRAEPGAAAARVRALGNAATPHGLEPSLRGTHGHSLGDRPRPRLMENLVDR